MLIYFAWTGLRHRKDRWVIASPWWAPLEFATALSFLLLFGAGLYWGPAAWALAAFIRHRELCEPAPRVERPPADKALAEAEAILPPDDESLPELGFPLSALPALFLVPTRILSQ